MAEINLCRLCLANSENTTVLLCDETIDQILTKHRINFIKQKYNENSTHVGGSIKHICESCWSKTNDFDKFYIETENIHYSYINNIVKKSEETFVSVPVFSESGPTDGDCKYESETVVVCDANPFLVEEDLGPDKSPEQSDEEYQDREESDGDGNGTSSEWSEEERARPAKVEAKRKRNYKKKTDAEKVSVPDRLDEENLQLVEKYFTMKCDICEDDVIFKSFPDIHNHYRKKHSMNGYVTCCNQRFRRMGRVIQHCIWHENPEAFKCLTCNKCFQDNDKLTKHNVSLHVPNEEKQFKCDICGQMFAKQHLLNVHMKHRHTDKEDRPFKCSVENCEQRFILPALLRLHIKKVHENANSRVCDICAKFFKCSESYERHYDLVHSNIDQRVQCQICHHWFKHPYTLKGHMRRHNATTETCRYCGRVSKNKMTLRTHIRNVHSDVDTTFKPKNEFPCTVCGKLFAKKQTLKEHLTIHTGEAYLYECTFCPKTFRSSANMYSHRKRVHPREYEEKYANNRTQKQ